VVKRPTQPFDAVIVVEGPVGPALWSMLQRADRPLVPVADLSGRGDPAVDFVGAGTGAAVLQEMKTECRRILDRLNELPATLRDSADRDNLLLLAMAYSRDGPISAAWDPTSRELVSYPMARGVADARSRLEQMADLGLLTRRFFARTNLCGSCGSSRLNAQEVCVDCGSADLVDQSLMHHYRCGNLAPEPAFLQGHALVCPKCRRELFHYGVDYDRAGRITTCRSCNATMTEPDPAFVCMDCQATTPGTGVETRDWYHYTLTADGIMAVRSNRLPRIDLDAILTRFPRAKTKRDLLMLLESHIKIAERYDRPLTVCRLRVANAGALQRELGTVGYADALNTFLSFVVETLRETDLIAADEGDILIVFPETASKWVDAALSRVEARNARMMAKPFVLEREIAADRDTIAAMIRGEPTVP
jgi:hypothetical protein